MRHINNLDISKRCGIKPENTIYDFLEEVTNESFREKMLEVISWKDDENENIRKIGEDAELEHTPYLNSDIKDIPENILKSYHHDWYTDGEKYYFYSPCCR